MRTGVRRSDRRIDARTHRSWMTVTHGSAPAISTGGPADAYACRAVTGTLCGDVRGNGTPHSAPGPNDKRMGAEVPGPVVSSSPRRQQVRRGDRCDPRFSSLYHRSRCVRCRREVTACTKKPAEFFIENQGNVHRSGIVRDRSRSLSRCSWRRKTRCTDRTRSRAMMRWNL